MKKLAIAMALMFALGAVPSFAVNPAERQALIDQRTEELIAAYQTMPTDPYGFRAPVTTIDFRGQATIQVDNVLAGRPAIDNFTPPLIVELLGYVAAGALVGGVAWGFCDLARHLCSVQ